MVKELIKYNNGHLVVDAFINGRKGKFIIDTGATHNVISEDDISFFKMHYIHEGKVSYNNDIELRTEISKDNFEKTTTPDNVFILMDISHIQEKLKITSDEPVNGIIGAEYLNKTSCIIDYGKNILYLK